MTTPEPEVLVIGGGIAGFSAAQWLRSYEIPFLWIDADGRIGGALHHVRNRIENWPGQTWADGRPFARALSAHADALGLEPEASAVASIETTRRRVARPEAVMRAWPAIVLATGIQPRTLDAEGIGDIAAERVFNSSQRLAKRGRARDWSRVAVVGGGDGAFEGALVIRDAGVERVTVVHHSAESKAQQRFRERVAADEHIELWLESDVLEVAETDGRLVLGVASPDGPRELEVDAMLVKIGFEPRLPVLKPELERTHGGYLATDAQCMTSAAGIYAAGDVASPGFQSAVRAAAQGAHAAHAIAVDLGYRGRL